MTVIAVIALAAFLFFRTRQEEDIVCYINDEPVYEQEVIIAADRVELPPEKQRRNPRR